MAQYTEKQVSAALDAVGARYSGAVHDPSDVSGKSNKHLAVKAITEMLNNPVYGQGNDSDLARSALELGRLSNMREAEAFIDRIQEGPGIAERIGNKLSAVFKVVASGVDNVLGSPAIAATSPSVTAQLGMDEICKKTLRDQQVSKPVTWANEINCDLRR